MMKRCEGCSSGEVTGVCPFCNVSFFCFQKCFAKDWLNHDTGHHRNLPNLNVGLKVGSEKEGIVSEKALTQQSFNLAGDVKTTVEGVFALPKSNQIIYSTGFGAASDMIISYNIRDNGTLTKHSTIGWAGIPWTFLILKKRPKDLITGGRGGILIFRDLLYSTSTIPNPNIALKPPSIGLMGFSEPGNPNIRSLVELPNFRFASGAYYGELLVWNWIHRDQTPTIEFRIPRAGMVISLYFYKNKLLGLHDREIEGGLQVFRLTEKPTIKISFQKNIKLPKDQTPNSHHFAFRSSTEHFYTGLRDYSESHKMEPLIFEFSIARGGIRQLKGHKYKVMDVILSKNEDYLFSIDQSATIMIWNLLTSKRIQIFKSSEKFQFYFWPHLTYAPRSNRLIVTTYNGRVNTYLVNEPLNAYDVEEKEYNERINVINVILTDTEPKVVEIKFKNETFKIPSYLFGLSKGRKIEILNVTSHLRIVQIYHILMGYDVYFTNYKQYFEMYLIFYNLQMWNYCYLIVKKLELDTDKLDDFVDLFKMSVSHFDEFPQEEEGEVEGEFEEEQEEEGEEGEEVKRLGLGILSFWLFSIFKKREREMSLYEIDLRQLGYYDELRTFTIKPIETHPRLKDIKLLSRFKLFSEKMRDLIKNKIGMNLILKNPMNKKELKVHKEILIFKSRFFFEMFSEKDSDVTQVTINKREGLNFRNLILLMNYIYFNDFLFPLGDSSLRVLFKHAFKWDEKDMQFYMIGFYPKIKQDSELRFIFREKERFTLKYRIQLSLAKKLDKDFKNWKNMSQIIRIISMEKKIDFGFFSDKKGRKRTEKHQRKDEWVKSDIRRSLKTQIRDELFQGNKQFDDRIDNVLDSVYDELYDNFHLKWKTINPRFISLPNESISFSFRKWVKGWLESLEG